VEPFRFDHGTLVFRVTCFGKRFVTVLQLHGLLISKIKRKARRERKAVTKFYPSS